MARDAGAKKVIMASCAPPIRYPNVYGIDMPSRIELVAHQRTETEISTAIGADLVIFQTLEDLVHSCSQFNPTITKFDCSVFTGTYVTGGVDEDYLAAIESLRSDNAKIKKGGPTQTVGIELASCSGPMNGADAGISQVVGLNNAEAWGSNSENADSIMGLSNGGN